ncbi:MAG: hypothetical protein LBO02_03170 [Holosporaceae bacterium]|jgi:hypothetical protein|nr:hypothetical protein [Holosporaceae bacterium]
MRDNLNALIKEFGIIDAETKARPVSKDEWRIIKIQLQAAKIIASDVRKISKVYPHLSKCEIIKYLLNNWTKNIEDFASAMLEATNKKRVTTAG